MQGTSRAALAGAQENLDAALSGDTDGSASRQVSDGLYAVAGLLDREPSLRRAFTDPASSPASRQGLARQLLGGQLAHQPLDTVLDLVARRWDTAADLREAVERLAAGAAMRGAEAAGDLDDVEDELFRFARLLEREPALRSALTDPGLPDERKTALLGDLLSGAKPTMRQLVELAVTRRRTGSLEKALDELSELAARRRQRYVAQVRVAAPLDPAQEQRLGASLARIYGREVDLQVDVDPSVIGGVEVRVGDEVLNGTVARSLENVRRSLAG